MLANDLPAWVMSVINFKGGTGKSTVTIAIAESLCRLYQKRVAVIDCDFQCSASLALLGRRGLSSLIETAETFDQHLLRGFRSSQPTPTLAAVAVKPGRCVFEADGLIHLLPSNPSMPRAERHILSVFIVGSDIEKAYVAASFEIARQFRSLLQDFDFVLIDCPPGLTLFSEAAILASDGILVPTLPNDLSFTAIDHLRTEIARVRTNRSFDDLLVGTVLSKVRHRNATAHYNYHAQSIERMLDRASPSFRILRPYLPYCRELEAASWRDDDPDRLNFSRVYGEAAGRIEQLAAAFVTSCESIAARRAELARPSPDRLPVRPVTVAPSLPSAGQSEGATLSATATVQAEDQAAIMPLAAPPTPAPAPVPAPARTASRSLASEISTIRPGPPIKRALSPTKRKKA